MGKIVKVVKAGVPRQAPAAGKPRQAPAVSRTRLPPIPEENAEMVELRLTRSKAAFTRSNASKRAGSRRPSCALPSIAEEPVASDALEPGDAAVTARVPRRPEDVAQPDATRVVHVLRSSNSKRRRVDSLSLSHSG
jgi:hypothetical protein